MKKILWIVFLGLFLSTSAHTENIKEYKTKLDRTDLLKKRYKIWKDLYSSNKKIAPTLLA